jgi:hypothetical protein
LIGGKSFTLQFTTEETARAFLEAADALGVVAARIS